MVPPPPPQPLLLLLLLLLPPLSGAVEYGLSDMNDDLLEDPCAPCEDSLGWRSVGGRPCTGYRRVDEAQRVWVNRTRCIEDDAERHCRWSCGLCPVQTTGDCNTAAGDEGGAVNPVMLYIGTPCIAVSFVLASARTCCYFIKDKRVRAFLKS